MRSRLSAFSKSRKADETYIGRSKDVPVGPSGAHKNVVLTLVERGGIARSFHIDSATVARVLPIVNANIHKESILMPDEARVYQNSGPGFAAHGTVEHGARKYVRGVVHTDTVEGFYSIFKPGVISGGWRLV